MPSFTDDVASSVNDGIAHELRDHQGQLAHPFWFDLPRDMTHRRGASHSGSRRIRREVERKVGHKVPMREKGRRGTPSLLEHVLDVSAMRRSAATVGRNADT